MENLLHLTLVTGLGSGKGLRAATAVAADVTSAVLCGVGWLSRTGKSYIVGMGLFGMTGCHWVVLEGALLR